MSVGGTVRATKGKLHWHPLKDDLPFALRGSRLYVSGWVGPCELTLWSGLVVTQSDAIPE